MSKSDENDGSGGSKSARRRLGIRGVAKILFVLVVILFAAGFIVVRTSFFRKKVAEVISKKTGLVATVEGATDRKPQRVPSSW